MSPRVLITGGAGYIGHKLAARFLAHTDDNLLLWVRARDAGALEAKRARCKDLFPDDFERLSFAGGDLSDPDPFAAIDPRDIKSVIHPAADTRFDIDAATADSVNVGGTAKVLDFSRRCPSLESVALVGTVYSSGLRPGTISETLLGDEFGFANEYERSKWASEQLVRDYPDLPWRVFRLATILGDDDSGLVRQYNIAHKVMRLMFVGLLPIFPGVASMPIYFVTGDFIADAVFALHGRASPHTVFNVCHTASESLTLGQWLDQAFDSFLLHEEFERMRFIRPMLTALQPFRALARSVNQFSRDAHLQAVVKLVSPFAEQMFVSKVVENDELRALYPEYQAREPSHLLARVSDHLAQTNWGAEPTAGRAPKHLWEA